MKIADLPYHSRPREKLQRLGARGLRDAELLALILRTGYHGKNAVEVAERILRQYTLPDLLNLEQSKLEALKGIGPTRAATLKAIQEIALILSRTEAVPLSDPATIAAMLTNYRHKNQEYLIALYLNARREIISQDVITIGTLDSSLIHPREVFAPALQHRAASIVLAHNHPSGDSTPSLEDLDVTEKLIEAGELLAIGILDHIVIARDSWTSMRRDRLVEFRCPIK